MLDDQLLNATGAISAAAVAAMRLVFSSPRSVYKFAREATHEEVAATGEDCSLHKLIEAKVTEYIKLNCKSDGEIAAANLFVKAHTHQFDEEFRDMAQNGSSISQYLTTNGSDATALHEAYEDYKQALLDIPVPAAGDASQEAYAPVPGDEESERKAKIYRQVTARRRELVSFLALRDWREDVYKRNGQCTELLQRSSFIRQTGEPGKKNGLLMICYDLFPTSKSFSSATAHRDNVEYTEEMGKALKCMTAARGANTIVVACDGRSRKCRKKTEDIIIETLQDDEQKLLEGIILYKSPGNSDMRFSKRKTFGSGMNRESIQAILPVPKLRFKPQPRNHLAGCGESTTHVMSYSNVAFRHVKGLPRMKLSDKEKITGVTAPAVIAQAVAAATATKGHPLFWAESKETDVFIALYKDLSVNDVFDMTPGSGAAACAAAALGIKYEGIAMNADHASWLNNIMDKTIFAILAEGTDEDPDARATRSDIVTYFATLVEEGKQYMPHQRGKDDEEEEEDEKSGAFSDDDEDANGE
jgi:hypothetical protein